MNDLEMERASREIENSYKEGLEEGIRLYAWWKDGVQYVGSCGTTLEDALKKAGCK